MPKPRKSKGKAIYERGISLGNIDIGGSGGISIGHASSATVVHTDDPRSIREWWHEILRTRGQYSCYAIFLPLPADVEAIHYLTEYGKELNIISGKNCLVIALSKANFQRTDFDEGIWQKTVEEHASEGHSVAVAHLFGIEFTQFPCLLVFEDIRSSEHIVIKLTGMTAEEIGVRMRLIFAIIEIAVKAMKKPLEELEKQQSIEFLHKTGQSVTGKVSGLAEKTFEKAMEAWIKATIK